MSRRQRPIKRCKKSPARYCPEKAEQVYEYVTVIAQLAKTLRKAAQDKSSPLKISCFNSRARKNATATNAMMSI